MFKGPTPSKWKKEGPRMFLGNWEIARNPGCFEGIPTLWDPQSPFSDFEKHRPSPKKDASGFSQTPMVFFPLPSKANPQNVPSPQNKNMASGFSRKRNSLPEWMTQKKSQLCIYPCTGLPKKYKVQALWE